MVSKILATKIFIFFSSLAFLATFPTHHSLLGFICLKYSPIIFKVYTLIDVWSSTIIFTHTRTRLHTHTRTHAHARKLVERRNVISRIRILKLKYDFWLFTDSWLRNVSLKAKIYLVIFHVTLVVMFKV
jgi:hypothetical protein